MLHFCPNWQVRISTSKDTKQCFKTQFCTAMSSESLDNPRITNLVKYYEDKHQNHSSHIIDFSFGWKLEFKVRLPLSSPSEQISFGFRRFLRNERKAYFHKVKKYLQLWKPSICPTLRSINSIRNKELCTRTLVEFFSSYKLQSNVIIIIG